jgi:uncharacterized RDD family membrane protein YckC
MDQTAEPLLETQPSQTARFPGVWRRVVAFFVDTGVLAVLGLPLGLLLGERFAPVGSPARLVGLLIILPYLGVMGSRFGGGQTLGKRLIGLRVVDVSGQLLSLPRSFARAALLSLPWIFNGIRFGSLGPIVMATLWVAGILIFGVGGAIIGTFLLNRPTRQGFHDLLVGSYVIDASGLGLPVPGVSTRRPLAASTIWMAIVVVATTVMLVKGPDLVAGQFPPVLMESMSAIPGATSYEVKNMTTWWKGRSSNSIVAVIWFRGPPSEVKKAAQEVAAAMLQHHPEAATAQNLGVTVIQGWDVGVYSSTSSMSYIRPPAQWRAELGL